MNTGAMELRDYLAVLKRRRKQLIATAGVVFVASVLVAVLLPPVYRSTATIMIERQEIPPDLVQTTVTGYVQERIQNISRRILTNETLVAIAEEIGMYRPGDDKGSAAVARQIYDGIAIETQNVEAVADGRQATATVAFTISFEADDPQQAKAGADAVTRRFLQEEKRARLSQAETVTGFLTQQSESLAEQISELENKLAAFKKDNVSTLPEMIDINLRLMEQTEAQVERVQEQIQALKDRQLRLNAQLATTAPNAPVYSADGQQVLPPAQQLAVLRNRYLEASATYSPDHPDLARMRREMAVLEKQAGISPTSGLYEELAVKQTQLAELRRRYSDEHPDVIRLKRSIAEVERKIGDAPDPSAAAPGQATNPAYVQLMTELSSVEADLAAQQDQLKKLNRKRDQLERRLTETPEVEREYLRLSRDYENALQKYREVKTELLGARAAQQLELEQKAQRFSLVGEASLPGAPDRPNRPIIILIGLVLALGSGVGSVTIAEYMDRTVRGIRGVRLIFGAPPLATIPYVENGSDIAQRRAGKAVLILVTVLSIAAAVTAYRFYLDTAATQQQQD